MKIIQLFVFFLVHFAYVLSLGQDVRFEQITNVGAVHSCTIGVQDKLGYIWSNYFGRGIHRYDGKNFTYYIYETENSNSLGGNDVSSMYVDSNNILWIGYWTHGLDRFDPHSNQFEHFRHNPSDSLSLGCDSITCLTGDQFGNLFIGTTQGLCILNTKISQFSHFRHDKQDTTSLSYDRVVSLYLDQTNTLWIGTGRVGINWAIDGGLNNFNERARTFTRYMHDPQNPSSLFHNYVRTIFEDSNGTLWIGTGANGLQTLDRKNAAFISYYLDISGSGLLLQEKYYPGDLAGSVNGLAEDHKCHIWISTDNFGIFRYDPVTKYCKHYGISYSFTSDTIEGYNSYGGLSCFSSTDGDPWIINSNGDLFKVKLDVESLSYYSIECGEASAFVHDIEKNELWIAGTNGLLNRNLGTMVDKTWLNEPDNTNSLSVNNIFAMTSDASGHLWLATFGGGLCKFDPKSEVFTRYKNDPANSQSLINEYNLCIYIDDDGFIWIGTNSGLDRLDPVSQNFEHYQNIPGDSSTISSNTVYCVTQDQQKAFWIGTKNGLNMLDSKYKVFRHFLKHSNIKCVFSDHNNVVWAGAEDGLYFLDRNTSSFVKFKDQVFNGTITEPLGIIEDHDCNIWVSTRQYIIRIGSDRLAMDVFDEKYGVKLNAMGWSNNFVSQDGRIFIGHDQGYYDFYPQDIQVKRVPPKLSFSALYVKDVLIQPSKKGIITEPIWKAESIHLKHDQSTFAIEFATIDFENHDEKEYFFMLENYDDTWHSLDILPKAYFFELPHGLYHLRIRCKTTDGVWVEESIQISVSPPWWITWWAYSLYGLLFISMMYSGHRYQKQLTIRKEQEKSKQKQAILNERLRISRDLHDEVGATLSGIVMYSHLAKSQANDGNQEVKNSINIVQETASEMVNKLNDVVWLVNPEQDNLEKLIEKLEDFAGKATESQHIEFSINMPEKMDSFSLPIEVRKNIYLFCKEAINNAVKYSMGTLIELGVNRTDSNITFAIKDNGIGFDPEKVKRGNGLNNMQTRAEEIGADYTLSTKQGMGTFLQLKYKIT